LFLCFSCDGEGRDLNILNFGKQIFLGVFLLVVALQGCGENKENKYPDAFPQACIEYFDRWEAYLEKMENSKRLDEETMNAFKEHRRVVLAALKNGLFPTEERKTAYCLLNERSDSLFIPVDNIDNMTDAEFEKATHAEFIRQHYGKRRK